MHGTVDGVQAIPDCGGLDFAICHECVGLDGLKAVFWMVSWGCKSGLPTFSPNTGHFFCLETSICRVTCSPQLSSSLLATRAQGDAISHCLLAIETDKAISLLWPSYGELGASDNGSSPLTEH